VVCVYFRGACRAGDQKCLVRERQVVLTRIRVEQRRLYAEAVKEVEEDEGGILRGSV
jgi:hypothetical protein